MNRVFQVIYSGVRHCYVVVSEVAKRRTKMTGRGTERRSLLLTAAITASLLTPVAFGQPVYGEGEYEEEKPSEQPVYVENNKGYRSPADAVVIGDSSNKATGEKSIVLGGYGNQASGKGAIIIGGPLPEYSEDRYTLGQSNFASGFSSVVVGGSKDYATGDSSIAIGGFENQAIGGHSVVIGGEEHEAEGEYSVISGGQNNYTKGNASSISGGESGQALGDWSSIQGGYENIAAGKMSSIGGGYRNVTNDEAQYAYVAGGQNAYVGAKYATSIGGGSIWRDADGAVAIGYGSAVIADLSGKDKNVSDMGKAMAIGYQATADEMGTIAFGHDAGDRRIQVDRFGDKPSGYAGGSYENSYYNRLVKIADGIDDHDAVTVGQLNKALGQAGSKTHFYSVKSDDANAGNYNNDGATGLNALAAGVGAKAEGAYAVGIGTGKIGRAHV